MSKPRVIVHISLLSITAFLLALSPGRRPAPAEGTGVRFQRTTVPKTITLSWQGGSDLDLHVTGPLVSGDRFHLYESNRRVPGWVELDGDGTAGIMSETATIRRQAAGAYQVYVHRRGNGETTGGAPLSGSRARIELYFGGRLEGAFDVPVGQEGNLWTAFAITGDEITPINNMTFEESPRKVGSSPASCLIPGDILMGSMPDSLVPGKWSHVGIYIGNGKVIEAASVDTDVEEYPIESWEYPNMTWVSYFRVVSADAATRERAVRFTIDQEESGRPYDIGFHSKQVHGRSYYCSELVWAAYMHASGGAVNIESRPDNIGVYPWEIEDDEETAAVGGHYEKRTLRNWFKLPFLLAMTIWEGGTSLMGVHGMVLALMGLVSFMYFDYRTIRWMLGLYKRKRQAEFPEFGSLSGI